jgi:hypothetical protein
MGAVSDLHFLIFFQDRQVSNPELRQFLDDFLTEPWF